MNSRERVLNSVSHCQSDRIPADFYAVGEVWDKLKRHFNTENSDAILNALNIDCRWIMPKYIGAPQVNYPDGSFETWSGSILKNVKNKFGTYAEVIKYALDDAETIEDIDRNLKLPSIDEYDYKSVTEACKKYDEYCIIAGGASTFFSATTIRSMENILIDMAINQEIAQHLFQRCVEWHMRLHERILEAGKGRIDFLQIADDFSTQQGPLMSKEMFRTFFKGPLKKFVDLGKSYGARTLLHCCGSAYEFIEEFIDIGIDVLDPVQTTAVNMDPQKLKREFGNRITFHGAVDTQFVLPSGTPEDVRKCVRELVNILGKDGGYILSSCHYLQPDVPVENILALYDLSNR